MDIKLFVVIFILSCFICVAQTDSIETETENIIDDLLYEPDEETDDSDLHDEIQYYLENPININTATKEQLTAVPFIDLSTAGIIIAHRIKYGVYFSISELYSVSAIPDAITKKIISFLTVNTKPEVEETLNTLQDISFTYRTRVINDLQERKGFKDDKFQGSPYKFYNKLKLEYGDNINFGMLTDKDAGEASAIDFYSGYFNMTNQLNINEVIIGDYTAAFGQGLALSNPYGFSKGADAVYPVKKHTKFIKPYSSAGENNFLRGASFEYNREHVSLMGFYSSNYHDANTDSISGDIISTPLDGLHRTAGESSKRKSLLETTFGTAFKYDFSFPFSLGFLYYNSHFNRNFIPSGIYNIKGHNFNYYSTCYDLYIIDFNIFGETVFDGKTIATFNGLNFSPSPAFTYTISFRNYPVNYTNLHGFGFGERRGAVNNETGIYNGIRWSTAAGIINFYYDQFRFPYATYTNPLPSEGNEYLLSLSKKINKTIECAFKFKLENKEIIAVVIGQDKLVGRLKQSYRFGVKYSSTAFIRLSTRIEYLKLFIRDINLKEEGYLLYEDLSYKPLKGLTANCRIIFFYTDSFSSAIYEYENDLVGILNNPGLYGEGMRIYLAIRYEIIKFMSLSFKYSETYKPGIASSGTGYSEINGTLDNKIGFQLDFTL